MQNNSKIISGVIVLAVIVGLGYITINKKAVAPKDVTVNTLGGDTNTMNEDTNQAAAGAASASGKTADGVKVTTIKEGTGAVAKAGDTVAMNYTGTLTDGTVFDSNIDPKFQHVQPFVFTLGTGQVIKGWDIGVAGMKVGEKRKLEISADNAYGAAGAGGVIPPNASLTFEVELLAIK